LVVDVQVGVMRHAWDAPRIVENIGLAVERARRSGVPVIWVQHADDDLVADSPRLADRAGAIARSRGKRASTNSSTRRLRQRR
jgi:nicotinamidase-related amidase